MINRKTNFLASLGACFLAGALFAQNARIQIVHNSANAPAVDVFAGPQKIAANVSFRSASAFLTAPAGVPVQVRIKPASASTDTANPVFFRTYTLEANAGYYLIANGNLPGGTNTANPDGISTGFDITVIPGAKETASQAGNAELRIFHGSTDAPTVDIKAQGVATLVENAPFRGFSDYIPVPASSYTIQISPASGSPNLFAYQANLSSLAGQTALVLASGYLNPAANLVGGQNGPAFGVYAFTTSGQAIALPTATSRVQIIHNCANAPAVDIFVNGGKAVPALDFRKATPFVNLNAGVPLTVAIKGASASTDTSNPAFRQTYELAGGESYTLVATGLLTTQGFAANPNGIPVGFDLTVMAGAREIAATAVSSNNVDVRVLHGATDAPFVDVRVGGTPLTLVNNAGFRNFTPYLSAPNLDITLDITDSAQAVVVATFNAPLTAFADSALVVMASGFLNPQANQNGIPFGLLAVTPSGGAILLPQVTSVSGNRFGKSLSVFPNPANGRFQIAIPEGTQVSNLNAITSLGQVIPLDFEPVDGNLRLESQLSEGIYTLDLSTESGERFHSRIQIR